MKHPVDKHVVKRIRHRRWLIGMTQQKLAEKVGIKFLQIQKYETGANRVSASKLWDIADTLDTTAAFFFEGIESEDRSVSAEAVVANVLEDKEAITLVRAYYNIPEKQREQIFKLAKALAS